MEDEVFVRELDKEEEEKGNGDARTEVEDDGDEARMEFWCFWTMKSGPRNQFRRVGR